MSRRALVRGAAMSEEGVAVPLRERIVPRALPGTPEAIVESARDDADGIVSAAHAEAAVLHEAARREGYDRGRGEAAAEMADALAALAAAADGLAAQRTRIEDSIVAEATVLAIEVAARLVRAELAARPERVADVLRGAIRRAADRSSLVARVSPADLAACREAAPHILEEMGGIAALQVIDDPRVTPGSCVLETPGGDVDASFQSQLGRILEALVAPPDEGLVEPAGP